MASAITLQFQGKDVDFEKSDQWVAVRARAGMIDALHEDIELIAPGSNQSQPHMVGTFEIIDLARSRSGIEQDLDWLRARPAVASATHVFHIGPTKDVLIPTGDLLLTFAPHLRPHRQQVILSQYRLQVIETRGAGDVMPNLNTLF